MAVTLSCSDQDTSTNMVGRAESYVSYLRTNRGYFNPNLTRCNNDIIVFVSHMSDANYVVYVLTGNAARSKVTDSQLQVIIGESMPSFRTSLYDGIKYLLSEIL